MSRVHGDKGDVANCGLWKQQMQALLAAEVHYGDDPRIEASVNDVEEIVKKYKFYPPVIPGSNQRAPYSVVFKADWYVNTGKTTKVATKSGRGRSISIFRFIPERYVDPNPSPLQCILDEDCMEMI